MRAILTLALICLSLSGTGCFILDEMDSGAAIMDKNSARGNAANAAAAEEAEEGMTLSDLRARGAGALGVISGKVEEAMQSEPDPNNVVVSCSIDGRTEFTRKFDCQSRGGRLLSR